jgi:hypothetical protein
MNIKLAGKIMNKNSKRINSSCRREIHTIKGNILASRTGKFDGNGYAFKKAISELRKQGIVIKYDKQNAYYRRIDND